MRSRALGLLLGYAADRAFGDPQRAHPVAAFGTVAGRLEQRIYADGRARGVLFTATLVGATTALGVAVEALTRRHFAVHTLMTAAATWAVLGGRSLEREATVIGSLLDAGDLPGARQRLTHLVARQTETLSTNEVARAVVESVAENTSDAVVAPLFWGCVAGFPGLVGYRAANTLDAMVGYRNDRYRNFGWASARLDDLANLPAARAGGILVGLADPPGAANAWRAWVRDAAAHPSPNAGVVEAAFAGSLGLRLGGTNTYHGVVERRAELGDGRAPTPEDIDRTIVLARRTGVVTVLVAAGIAWYRRR